MAGQLMGEAFHALLRMWHSTFALKLLAVALANFLIFSGRASDDTDPDGTRNRVLTHPLLRDDITVRRMPLSDYKSGLQMRLRQVPRRSLAPGHCLS